MNTPTKCTAEAIALYCAKFRETMNRQAAADAIGVNPKTVRGWMVKGRAQVAPFAAFWAALEVTDTLIISDLVSEIRFAKDKSWRAKAWLLERLYPSQFGQDAINQKAVGNMLDECFDEVIRGLEPEVRERVVYRLAALRGISTDAHRGTTDSDAATTH